MLRTIILAFAILLPLIGLGFHSIQALHSVQQPQSPSQIEQDMEDRRFHEANKKRQNEIREDTQKLFQLASELKSAVEKTDENTLSLDVVKKAEEVEKLAKKVKDKMKEGTPKAPKPLPLPSPPHPL